MTWLLAAGLVVIAAGMVRGRRRRSWRASMAALGRACSGNGPILPAAERGGER